jgi:hypothetical protein
MLNLEKEDPLGILWYTCNLVIQVCDNSVMWIRTNSPS